MSTFLFQQNNTYTSTRPLERPGAEVGNGSSSDDDAAAAGPRGKQSKRVAVAAAPTAAAPKKLCGGVGTSKPLPPALADLAGTLGIRGISEAAWRHALATFLRSSDGATENDNAKLSRYNEEWSDRLNAAESRAKAADARTAAADARVAAVGSDADARVANVINVKNTEKIGRAHV